MPVCVCVLFLPVGSAYYDNVRPLAYPDSDAVLICFDISRPETLDSVLKKVGVRSVSVSVTVFSFTPLFLQSAACFTASTPSKT